MLKLNALSAKTRRAPEIWAGLYFFGTAVGLPLRVLGHSLAPTHPGLAFDINILGHAFFASACIAMAMFTWRVFRPETAWARAFAIGTTLGIAATTFHTVATGSASAEGSISMLFTNAARIVPIGWAFVESTLYFRAMRKRAQLGLADPVLTNRFFLWSLWTAALAVLPATALMIRSRSGCDRVGLNRDHRLDGRRRCGRAHPRGLPRLGADWRRRPEPQLLPPRGLSRLGSRGGSSSKGERLEKA